MKKNYLHSEKRFSFKLFLIQNNLVLLFILLLLAGKSTQAQTAGPNNAGTGTNVTGVGTVAWTSFGNVTAADGVTANAVFTGSANSNYIQGTNYGFAIPIGVVVDGIEVTINRKTSAVNAGRITKDNVVSMVKGGAIVGNNKATTTAYTTTLTTATYGSPTDKWGTTWTSADINATNFGAVISVNANNSLTAAVDYIQIKVYYTPVPMVTSFTGSSACVGTTPSVVITGNYFTGATAVKFNGVSASFTVNSATQITATLPVSATTGTISVTTPSGTGTSAGSFTINPLPSVAPITGTTNVCIGGSTTLNEATSGGTWSSASPTKATINTSGVVTGIAAGTSLITYTYTNGNGCTNSVSTTITVTALPVVVAASSVCIGNTIQATPNSGGTWASNDTSKATIDTTGLIIGITSGNVTFTYTDTTTGCNATTSIVSVVSSPVITSNPVATQTVCSGNSASFSVTATGGGLTYQWYNGATLLTNGGAISGATSSTLTINPVALSDAGTTYYCEIIGSCSPAISSNTAELIVLEKATITDQPIGVQSFCAGDTASLAVSATGDGITYQWYKGATMLVDNGTVSGATSATLTLSPLSVSDSAANYYCLVTGTSPCNAVSSNFGTINVNQGVSITAQPQISQTVCESSSASFSVSASGGNLSYQWYKGASPVTNGGTISGATTATLTIASTTTTNSGSYYCLVSNNCSGSTASDNALLTVSANSVGGTASSSLPNVTPVVRNITQCHFASGTVYLSGHIGSVVRWEYTTSGGASWIPIANTTTSCTYNNITQSTFFRAVVQNNPCSLAYSYVALIDVIPNVKPTPVTATPQTICIGGSSDLYSESGFATSSYLATGGSFSNANPANWLVDGCGNCLNAGGSNTTEGPFRLSATNGGTYSGINYTSSGKFAIANGNYYSVMQTPIFNTFGLPMATLSFNHAFNLQVGASVSVELSLDGGTTYSVVLASYTGASTRSPYGPFPNQSIDLSNYIGQASLRVRFVYNGTANSSWAVDNILIPETPSNLTTQWIDSITGQVISNTATATVTPTVTTTYAITSYLNGCTSYGPEGTTYITITVNQRPTAAIGPNQTVCNGDSATFSVALTGVAPWSVTYSNGTTSTTVNNVTTNPYVFTVSGFTTNKTYTITALSDSKCIAKPQDLTGSAVVTVLNGTAGLWTGLISTDWFDCRNWAGGLPSATINAQIPSSAVRMPLIDPANSSYAALYSNIARAQDIIIANTASVAMAANSNLYISRDWKNSGTFIPGTGTVTFNGATANQIQTINAGIKTNETFYNFTLNNSNGARGISVVDGFALNVANLLSLQSGDLRLVGEAQLLQSGTTANPSSGTGKILKDQQGSQSSYHYNYWSSPVTTNGSTYTVGGVLRDGTNSASNPFNPGTINFGGGYYFADGALSSPIKISTSWIYKFTSVSSSYAGWQFIGDTGTINPGEGFTMKGNSGSSSNTTAQNYVFVGKPNNGTISLNISPNQTYLAGNPYPSSLDADEFIKDNVKDGGGRAASNIFNGALYFWDHFGGTAHILGQYVGGYATYSLMGGVVAISNDPLTANNGLTGTKVPTKNIAVGQGFFIGTGVITDMPTNNPNLTSPITGGTINFKNSQRVFKTESPANSVFFRTNATQATVNDERSKSESLLNRLQVCTDNC
ncbi:beta strand repeat-containing protein [Flavobacterium phycosphaerae]|uniref:beta strand repeat-containing protein n=1 Tax=Flavobacterium phycosphaerae TaxID=2697515 RepID=UPI001389ACBE|nr:immunoglobulin domain-containing protein [Flavobacterium phycosphaerae]